MPIVLPEQGSVELGRSRINPADTFVSSAAGAEATYKDSMSQTNQLVNALSNFGSTMKSIGDEKMKEEMKNVDLYVGEVASKLNNTDPYEVQIAKLMPEKSHWVRAAMAEALGRQHAQTEAQRIYEGMRPEDRSTPEAAEAYFNRQIGDAHNRVKGQVFYGRAYLNQMRDYFSRASGALSTERRQVIQQQLEQDARTTSFEDLSKAVKDRAVPINATLSPDPDGATAIDELARKYKVSAIDLATIMSFETGGTFKVGKTNPAGTRHGLIQFGPNEAAQFGSNPNQTTRENVAAVERYLVARGLKPGMNIEQIYLLINPGKDGKGGPDGNGGTPRQYVERMLKEHTGNALKFLGLPSDARLLNASGREPKVTPPTGSAFTAPGVEITPAFRTDFEYGKSATANKQDFNSVVIHHATGTADSLIKYGQSVDAKRGGAFGYHFYIDEDGKVFQGAPMDKRTNHVKEPGHAQRKDGTDVSNSNAIGVSLINAEKGATPAQEAALKRLVPALAGTYGINPERIVGHGELQGDRMETEGVLARSLRTQKELFTTAGSPAVVGGAVAPSVTKVDGVTVVPTPATAGDDEALSPTALRARAALLQSDAIQAKTNPLVDNIKRKKNAIENIKQLAWDTLDPALTKAIPTSWLTPDERKELGDWSLNVIKEQERRKNQQWTEYHRNLELAKRKVETELNDWMIKLEPGQPIDEKVRSDLMLKANQVSPELAQTFATRLEAIQNGRIDQRVELENYKRLEQSMYDTVNAGGDPTRISTDILLDPKLVAKANETARNIAKAGGEIQNDYYKTFFRTSSEAVFGSTNSVSKTPVNTPYIGAVQQNFLKNLTREIVEHSKKPDGANITDDYTRSILANRAFQATVQTYKHLVTDQNTVQQIMNGGMLPPGGGSQPSASNRTEIERVKSKHFGNK